MITKTHPKQPEKYLCNAWWRPAAVLSNVHRLPLYTFSYTLYNNNWFHRLSGKVRSKLTSFNAAAYNVKYSQQFGEGPFLFQRDSLLYVNKAFKKWFSQFGGELVCTEAEWWH